MGIVAVWAQWAYSCGQYESQCESQWPSLGAEMSEAKHIFVSISPMHVIIIKIRLWELNLMYLIADISAFDDPQWDSHWDSYWPHEDALSLLVLQKN